MLTRMTMSNHHSTTGIPFPQATEVSSNGGSATSEWRSMDRVHDGRSSSQIEIEPQHTSSSSGTVFAAPAPPPSPPRYRGQYQSRGHGMLSAIRTESSGGIPLSSSRHSAGLPSIRNLLSSIGQDEQSTHRHTDELPNSAHASFAAFASHHETRQLPYGSMVAPPVRSLSPSKRPPIAPSAFAHSQFPSSLQHTSGRSSNDQFGNNLKRSPPTSTYASLPPSEVRVLRTSGLRSAHAPMSLTLMDEHSKADHDEAIGGPSQTLAKRTMNARSDLDEVPLSPASLRRRHTVGALEEPTGARFEGIKRENGSSHSVQRLASPARIGLESPTTPTAGQASSSEWRQDTHSTNSRSDQAALRGKSYAHAAPPTSYMYMQHSLQGTGSMPSLSSSISSASAGSDRGRVLSLENASLPPATSVDGGHGGGGKHPPSAWNASHLAHGKASISGSETLASPHSSVWHSRSSTLDSIDTTSSLASTPSGKSHNRVFVTEHVIREAPAPTTPTHNREGYNRDWRFPQTTQRSQQHGVQAGIVPRTRHESLNSQSSEYSASSAGILPRSPFANLTLASPSDVHHSNGRQDADGQYIRPRAQTMTYYDRRIAPLPSHSIHAHHAGPGSGGGGEYGGERQLYALSPQRSFSAQSASSLPHRIAAMDVNMDGVDTGGVPYGSIPRRRLSSSSGHAGPLAAGNTMIVNASASGSAAGAAKYECGWCGKRFSRPSSLKIHHHSHTGEKPFVCSEPGCGRTFSVQSNLRRHQKSHLANARRIAGGATMDSDGSSLSRAGSYHLSQSNSMPLTASTQHGGGGGASYNSNNAAMGGAAVGLHRVTSTSPKNHLQRFGSMRERKTSISSSAAADDEGEYSVVEDTEIDDGVSIHSAAARSLRGVGLGKRRPSYDDEIETDEGEMTMNAESMQDIREEAHGTNTSSSSSDERPPTAGSMQARFRGLLKAAGGRPVERSSSSSGGTTKQYG